MAWKRSTVRTRPGPPILSTVWAEQSFLHSRIIPAHRFGQPALLYLQHRLLAPRNIEQHVAHRGLRLRVAGLSHGFENVHSTRRLQRRDVQPPEGPPSE